MKAAALLGAAPTRSCSVDRTPARADEEEAWRRGRAAARSGSAERSGEVLVDELRRGAAVRNRAYARRRRTPGGAAQR
jgi:hypothetical protein